jgi:hypothetical protein
MQYTRSIFSVGAVSIALALVLAGPAQAQVDYLQMARDYADVMIAHGRDTYGSTHSPLFASAMERDPHELLAPTWAKRIEVEENWGWPNKARPYYIEGIRMGDRTVSGGNVGHDQDLYRLLYRLSNTTGQAGYAQQADAALSWWLANAQSPETDLMAWGEQTAWDFTTEHRVRQYEFNWPTTEALGPTGPGNHPADGLHEFYENWTMWDKALSLNASATRDFALGLWNNQIHNQQTGTFSRHAGYDEHWTDSGHEYPRHGGYYIETWARAYVGAGDPGFRAEMIEAIDTIVDGFESRRDPVTGRIPAGESNDAYWGSSTLELAIQAHTAAGLIGDAAVAAKLRQLGEGIDQAYLDAGLQEQDFGISLWSKGYGQETDARTALLVLQRYHQLDDPAVKQQYEALVLAAGGNYLTSDPDTSITLYPGAVADAIDLMLGLYRLTGQQQYLDRAHAFGQFAADTFFPGDSPLPTASDDHDFYEAITGGPDLMYSLADLALIPEPASMTLLGLGMMVVLRRPRR